MTSASNRKKRRDERTGGNLAYRTSVRAKCNLLPYHLHYVDNCCKKSFLKNEFSRKLSKMRVQKREQCTDILNLNSCLCKTSFVFFCFNLFSVLLQPFRLWKWVSSITSYLNQLFQKRICYFDQLLNAN